MQQCENYFAIALFYYSNPTHNPFIFLSNLHDITNDYPDGDANSHGLNFCLIGERFEHNEILTYLLHFLIVILTYRMQHYITDEVFL